MRRSWWIRLVGVALGAWAVVLLVRTAGTDDFVGNMRVIAPAIGLLLILELARLATEVGATATQLGRYLQPLGSSLLLRGHLWSYATTNLAPGGRVAGEVVKAASYAPMLGRPVAAAIAIRIQAASLLAGGAMSAVCAAVAYAFAVPAWLWIGLLVHTMLVIGVGWMLLQVGRWGGAKKTAGKLGMSLSALREGMEALPGSIIGAVCFLFLGRWVQVGEMAALLAVLARTPTLADSLIMEGIFMVGTAVGDLIPAQLGATDAAFTLGSSSLSVTVSQGLAMAAALHIVQLAMAALCALTAISPITRQPVTQVQAHPRVSPISSPP